MTDKYFGGFRIAVLAVGLAVAALPAQASDMRNPFLNDLRGFSVSCADIDVERADALCKAVQDSLATRYGKPVEIAAPGTLPQAGTDQQFLNFIWMEVAVSGEIEPATIAAKYGSTLAMSGVSDKVEVGPVSVSACATPAEMAEMLLKHTPFGGAEKD